MMKDKEPSRTFLEQETYVQAVAFAIEVSSADLDAAGDRNPIQVGDRWAGSTAAGSLTMTLAMRHGRIEVVLVFRNDAWDDEGWKAAQAMPAALALHMECRLAWMLCDWQGHHARARFPSGIDPAQEEELFRALHSGEGNELVMIGVRGNIIRSIKKGSMMHVLWPQIAGWLMNSRFDAVSELPLYEDVERHKDCSIMFAQGMREHLERWIR